MRSARSIADLYQQQASVAGAGFNRSGRRARGGTAKVDLIQTLKLDPAGTYEFTPPPVDSATPTRALDVTSLMQRAMQQRRDVDAEQSRLSAALKAVQAAGATQWPSLALSVGYNSSYASSNESSFLNQLDQRRGGSIGLSLSFPLFDRFSTRINSQRAEIQQQNAEIALDDLRQQVRTGRTLDAGVRIARRSTTPRWREARKRPNSRCRPRRNATWRAPPRWWR
ncbi:MAG: TolC family protein [Gemmatimonadaceae bacterium]